LWHSTSLRDPQPHPYRNFAQCRFKGFLTFCDEDKKQKQEFWKTFVEKLDLVTPSNVGEVIVKEGEFEDENYCGYGKINEYTGGSSICINILLSETALWRFQEAYVLSKLLPNRQFWLDANIDKPSTSGLECKITTISFYDRYQEPNSGRESSQ
jgi:hypothetical protein